MHLLDDLLSECQIKDYVLWYYTPMARSFTRHLQPTAIVFDCMDELSLFKHAPKELVENEAELMQKADVVFTGGQSLYEAKKDRHPNIHAFPSSIDYLHFAQARRIAKSKHEPEDQRDIPHPRMGFYGVIDERFDIELMRGMAEARPDWSFVLIGPTAKIDPNDLPKNNNIYHLGPKSYQELPVYLAGWDVAMMPFAKNDSTKFISPTKTPEFLAAGKPVVSTSIQDVVRPYGELGLVKIADEVATFIKAAAECGMDERALPDNWLETVDQFLSKNSWDRTWSRMEQLITTAVMARRATRNAPSAQQSVSLQTNNAEVPKLSAQVA
jgi:UDP-galactopyranose mutase